MSDPTESLFRKMGSGMRGMGNKDLTKLMMMMSNLGGDSDMLMSN